MSYVQENLYFDIKDICFSEISDKFSEFLFEDCTENYCDNFYASFNNAPTIIRGFGNENKIVDGRVYRSGMAVKYFGDLVCDYFGEPRIERTY